MNIASKFTADEAYGVGTVLAFGGPNDVTRAGGNSTSICGVVTDTADFVLNNKLSGPNVVIAAVIGRTKCEVLGPINKGDVLVIGPSGCPQSVNITYDDLTDPQAPGTIIGRALDDCAGGFYNIDIFINAA